MSDDNKEVNFDAAFEELTKLTDDKPAQLAAEAAPAPEATPAPESSTPAQEKPGEETPTQAQESQDAGSGEQAEHEGAGEGAPAGSEGADSGDEGLGEGEGEGAPDPDEDLLNRLGSLLAKAKVPQKEPEPAPQPAQQRQAAQDQPEEITLSADEIKAIEDAEKDWPDVVRAVRAESEFKLKRTMDHIFKEVARELRPLMQTVQTLAHRTHLQELQSKVPDYDSVGDKVISWVDKQPAYLQAAYKHVIQQGTAEEVADLITRYKAETGNRAPAPTPAPVTKKKAELPTATKQAAAALAPVSTKRTAPVSGGVDPSDFDGAFAAFADKVN